MSRKYGSTEFCERMAASRFLTSESTCNMATDRNDTTAQPAQHLSKYDKGLLVLTIGSCVFCAALMFMMLVKDIEADDLATQLGQEQKKTSDSASLIAALKVELEDANTLTDRYRKYAEERGYECATLYTRLAEIRSIITVDDEPIVSSLERTVK